MEKLVRVVKIIFTPPPYQTDSSQLTMCVLSHLPLRGIIRGRIPSQHLDTPSLTSTTHRDNPLCHGITEVVE